MRHLPRRLDLGCCMNVLRPRDPYKPYYHATVPRSSHNDPNRAITNSETMEGTSSSMRPRETPQEQRDASASTGDSTPGDAVSGSAGGPTSDDRSLASLWSAMQLEVDRERARAERIGNKMVKRLSRLKPPPRGSDLSSGQPLTSQPRPPGDESIAWVTWLLSLTTVAVFLMQWRPMVPLLLEGVRSLDPETVLAFFLVAPETSWKLVRTLLRFFYPFQPCHDIEFRSFVGCITPNGNHRALIM